MKIIEKIKKYCAEVKEKNEKRRAEDKELETHSNVLCKLGNAFWKIYNRSNTDIVNHIGWTVGDYKWQYHLMEIALDDARFEYENLMSIFGGELTDAHRASIKIFLDWFISFMTTKQVRLCSEATTKFPGNDITKI